MHTEGLTFVDADAAPHNWNSIEFISDLHLQANYPKTFQAFSNYLDHCEADALFILGDLFEIWVGDDILDLEGAEFERQCIQVLQHSSTKRPTFIMHGNRDFLLGHDFFRLTQCTFLADPCVLAYKSSRYCLSHGDAYCYADTQYMQTRSILRSPEWIANVLAKPLQERLLMGAAMRQESANYQSGLHQYADLDQHAMVDLLQKQHCHTLIHGHTHRPQIETLSPNRQRIVLSDWDFEHTNARGSVLRLTREQREPIVLPL